MVLVDDDMQLMAAVTIAHSMHPHPVRAHKHHLVNHPRAENEGRRTLFGVGLAHHLFGFSWGGDWDAYERDRMDGTG